MIRFIVTLVGDTVNVAQRLEQIGKRYGSDREVTIIASRAVLERAGMLDRDRSLGPQDIRGRRGSLEIYAVA